MDEKNGDWEKTKERKMTTLAYWRKLLKEANIEVHEVERIAMDRVKWKNVVESRKRHIEQFEKQQEHQYRRHDDEEIMERRSQYEVQDDNKCKYEGCGRTFRTKAGLAIHQKGLHRTMEKGKTFRCQKCNGKCLTRSNTEKPFKSMQGWKNRSRKKGLQDLLYLGRKGKLCKACKEL